MKNNNINEIVEKVSELYREEKVKTIGYAVALSDCTFPSYYANKAWFFKKGNIYPIKKIQIGKLKLKSVCVNSTPIFDYKSELFTENFKFIKDIDKYYENHPKC